jgi:hypothetical protein
MAMVDILPLATPEELVALEGLLRQQTVAVTGEFPGDSGTPAATGPAGTKRRDAPVLAPDRLVSTTAIERADHPTDTGQMEIATQDDRHASVDADTAMTRPSSGSVPIAASASPVRPEVVTVPRREPFDLPKAPSLASSVQRALLDRGDTMLSLRDANASRLLYQRAADEGVGLAAFKLAQTYDPTFLAAHNLLGIKPDPAVAEAWYRKAEALGVVEATGGLRSLAGRR